MILRTAGAIFCIALFFFNSGRGNAARDFILLQSTTSTLNSGLYDAILPEFSAISGFDVRVVAVGTGQALRNAANCNADVLIVHAKEAELQFINAGYGENRFDLMHNDFLLVGPEADPAGVRNATSPTQALAVVAESRSPFVSRGDESGTHAREKSLWKIAGLNPIGPWYRETGSGMGATLNIAVGMGAYTLADRATWVAFRNKSDHAILFEGGRAMFNQYGIISVSAARCPNVKSALANEFVSWMLSESGQTAIGAFRVDGQQVYFPTGQIE